MSKVFTITAGLENLGAIRTGGQGSVYKGKRTGAIYSAVKLIPTPIHTESADDKNYRNFQNEVTKLQKVNERPNPNVVKILSWGITESGSFPYIEMEYIDGPDLGELLQSPHPKIFTLKELIKVADQLACALVHCHMLGIKHGDIKSNNVKYNIHTGNYVLLDFGLAIMTEEQRRTSIRHAGAIEFMAPEQHEGKMMMQTDVYSYGVILYELLTGQVPFPLLNDGDGGRNTIMLAHMESKVPDALQLRRANLPENWKDQKKLQEMQVPQWLLNLIYKCLQKDPESRYASGMAVHDAIVEGTLATVASGQAPVLNPVTLPIESFTAPAAADSSKILVSKPIYYGLIVMMVISMGFAVYSTFIKKDARMEPAKTEEKTTPPPTDTVPQTDPEEYQEPVNNYANPLVDSAEKKPDTQPEKQKPKVNTDTVINLQVPDSTAAPQ